MVGRSTMKESSHLQIQLTSRGETRPNLAETLLNLIGEVRRRETSQTMAVDNIPLIIITQLTYLLNYSLTPSRYKSLKDLKDEILKHHIDFNDMTYGLVLQCLLEFSTIGLPLKVVQERYFGLDDYRYWFVILEDKLRDGEEPYELNFNKSWFAMVGTALEGCHFDTLCIE
ncbi:hypothetical protein E3N88_20030 [Mikania micrantha]|uniref:Uncharacterized protein n=1 Tax=Mikania micrantha TaxID=192012 RepID=A0A5N6NI95_9ASTR|nr:hypothetical protein E3N88_20030 [Mikania micrantha]